MRDRMLEKATPELSFLIGRGYPYVPGIKEPQCKHNERGDLCPFCGHSRCSVNIYRMNEVTCPRSHSQDLAQYPVTTLS